MPPIPRTHRPQTLKQAKKAYHRSGATVRLSDSEKAVLERRAVLQERADRIKEREARRKANLKRKEERVQREREARHRMGISTPPVNEGIQVGPSQLHLSEFLYAGTKRKAGDEVGGEEKKTGQQKGEELRTQESPMQPPRSRQPLGTLSTNASPSWMIPSQIAHANSPKVLDFALQEKRTTPKRAPPARGPLQAKSANPMIQPKPLALDNCMGGLQAKAPNPPRPLALPTDQPPLRQPLPALTRKSIVSRKPLPIPLPPKPEPIPEDCYDDFFVSNTQIQRELSPPPTPPAKTTTTTSSAISTARPATPPPAFKPPSPAPDTFDLLAHLSTQDLDFPNDLTQTPAPPAPQGPDACADEDFPDDELEDMVLEYELESSAKTPSNNAPTPDERRRRRRRAGTQSDKSSGSHYGSDDDAEVQAAGLQMALGECDGPGRGPPEARRDAEWDEFDLSTQDLRELEA